MSLLLFSHLILCVGGGVRVLSDSHCLHESPQADRTGSSRPGTANESSVQPRCPARAWSRAETEWFVKKDLLCAMKGMGRMELMAEALLLQANKHITESL